MLAKVREETVPSTIYLDEVKSGDISENQDVQRKFCSDNSFINGIAVTILTGNYLPPLIIGEIPVIDGIVQKYIVDGMQRTTALRKIRYENYRITTSVEDSVIEYQAKKYDTEGHVCRDENGNVIWRKCFFDIKNKTFEQFPKELQRKFDTFQLRVVTHQECTMLDVSKLVRRYNNHKGMNTSQRAFTYLDSFARHVKNIVNENRFFKDTIQFAKSASKNGTHEKIVCESVMTVFHLDSWKERAQYTTVYLNENATENEFNIIDDYADRLYKICDDEFQELFSHTSTPVWFAVFDKFVKTGLPDGRFYEFLTAFVEKLHSKEVDGISYDTLAEDSHPRSKKIVMKKINLLTALMNEFLQVGSSNECKTEKKYNNITPLELVQECVNPEATKDDIEDYEYMLDACLKVDDPLRDAPNLPSLISIIAWAYQTENDVELEDWMYNFVKEHSTYVVNQKENYLHMKKDFEEYLHKLEVEKND